MPYYFKIMGCQSCKSSEINDGSLLQSIANSIKSNSHSSLKIYLSTCLRSCKTPKASFLATRHIQLSTYEFSFLGYSLVTGSIKCFRLLHERFSCSIPSLLQEFSEQKINPVNILCEKNHFELLKYFLPLYFQNKPKHHSLLNDTLDFHNTDICPEATPSISHIQAACLYGSVASVDSLHQYFKEHPYAELDLNEKHEERGESSVFFAVRSGSILIVKLLFENYNMNFKVLNKFNENLLQVCALCSSHKRNPAFFEIFGYLIEKAKIDPTYNYEEILILLKDRELINYYQEVLRSKGIFVEKIDLELKNLVKPCLRTMKEEKQENDDWELENPSLISAVMADSQGTEFGQGSIFENKLQIGSKS